MSSTRTVFAAGLLASFALGAAQEPYNADSSMPDAMYVRPDGSYEFDLPPVQSNDQVYTPVYDAQDPQQADYNVRWRMTKVDSATLSDILNAWTGKPREVADKMISKYGEPNEATEGRLVWWNNGVWRMTILENVEIPHEFPVPHSDMLYQAIGYMVPADKFDDLAAYDGSVIAERTRGTLGARCDKEEANFLAVNLADDIIRNRKSVSEARDFYKRTIDAMMSNSLNDEQRRYTSGFTFNASRTPMGDRDGSQTYAQAYDDDDYDAESAPYYPYTGTVPDYSKPYDPKLDPALKKKKEDKCEKHRFNWDRHWDTQWEYCDKHHGPGGW